MDDGSRNQREDLSGARSATPSVAAVSRRRLLAMAGAAVFSALTVQRSFAVVGSRVVVQRLPPGDTWRPRLFDEDQATAVARMAEAIIPRTDTPGAIDAGVPEYVDLAVSVEEEAVQRRFLKRLAAVEEVSRSSYGSTITELDDGQLHELLDRISDQHDELPEDLREAGRFFADLKKRAVFGYYTSLEGRTEELGLPARVERVELAGCARAPSSLPGDPR